MMMPDAMTQDQLKTLIAAGWARATTREALEKEFKFKGFRRAFGFMAAVAVKADALNHHPEWFNVYNRVQVLLTTHDTGGLSGLDWQLAQAMDSIAAEIAAAPGAPKLAG
ncbi:4a-hydroxytetrahydrobiopterin dehydratase [Abyssibius alkaniclasticus]|uniref:4a-hydroxytetrahydrobiopterin dehydratase n=1 Tax=Abyssibius alkaniclasticus TaxID=2881234 RepID=UPI004057EADE